VWRGCPRRWPIQAVFWLESGVHRGAQGVPTARSRFRAVHSDSSIPKARRKIIPEQFPLKPKDGLNGPPSQSDRTNSALPTIDLIFQIPHNQQGTHPKVALDKRQGSHRFFARGDGISGFAKCNAATS